MATLALLAAGEAQSQSSAQPFLSAVSSRAVAQERLTNDAPVALAAAITAPAQSTLSAALTSGTTYTSLPVAALPTGVGSGDLIELSSGANTQTFVAQDAAASGATAIPVFSLAANFSYPVGSVVFDRSESVTVTRASTATGWPGDSNSSAPSANFRLNVSDGTNQELMLVTGGQGTTTLTVTRAVEPIGTAGSPATAYAFGTTATMTPTITAAGFFTAQPASYDTTVLTKLSLAPVAYWKLNDPVGSTTAADSSGNGYTLTVHGTVTFGEPSVVPSDAETSAQSDGSTGYLSPASFPAKIPTGASPVTVVLCQNVPLAQTGEQQVYATGGGPWIFEYEMFTFVGSTIQTVSYFKVPATRGIPHLIGLAFDGQVGTGYVDGSPVVEQAQTAEVPPSTQTGPWVLCNSGPNQYSNWPVGRVAIFAGVLTPKDWALLIQAFTGV